MDIEKILSDLEKEIADNKNKSACQNCLLKAQQAYVVCTNNGGSDCNDKLAKALAKCRTGPCKA